MAPPKITVEARIDGKTFLRFALFDILYHQKRWKSPLLFLLIMGGFSAACFAFSARNNQAVLLGGVLLGVGLCLPAGYFLSYALSVRKEARRIGAEPSRIAYRVRLSAEGVEVAMGEEERSFTKLPWKSVYRAYRVRGCIYLYRTFDRAFLLADSERKEEAWEDKVWSVIQKALPQDKLRDLRRRR